MNTIVKPVLSTQVVRATLQKMKRLENNSYRGINPFNNQILTLFHPNHVPSNFNETEVEITLRTGSHENKITKTIAKQQELSIAGLSIEWKGYPGQRYNFYVECAVKYGNNMLPLGTAEFHGNPMVPGVFEGMTLLYFEFPGLSDPPSYNEIHLFEATLKLEIVQASAHAPVLTA